MYVIGIWDEFWPIDWVLFGNNSVIVKAYYDLTYRAS